MPFVLQWNTPPTRGVIFGAKNAMGLPCVSVTDNGVHRTAVAWKRMRDALDSLNLLLPTQDVYTLRVQLIPGVTGAATAAMTSPESRALIAWAKKLDFTKSNTHTEGSGALVLDGVKTMPTGIPSVPTVTYDGFKAVQKYTAHTLDALHAMVIRSLRICLDKLGWSATGLTVQFHSGRRALGLAFNPGAGDRRVSLARELLDRYDIGSIERTMLHELVHHAREELYPRRRTRFSDAHDDRFCEVLGKVDPTVIGSYNACKFVDDEVDLQVVAESSARSGVVYTPTAGVMLLGHGPDGRLRWRWDPTGSSKWRSSWAKMTDHEVMVFLRSFPVADRARIPVRYESTGRAFLANMIPEGAASPKPGVLVAETTAGWMVPRLVTHFPVRAQAKILEAMTA